MAGSKPMQATHEIAQRIQERASRAIEAVERALKAEERNVSFAYPELDENERRREIALGAIRCGQRMLDEVIGHIVEHEDEPTNGKRHPDEEWHVPLSVPSEGG